MVIGKNAARIIVSTAWILLSGLTVQAVDAQQKPHIDSPVLDLRGTWLENQSIIECETSKVCSGLWEFGVSADGTARWSVPSATCLVVVQKITPTSIEILRVPSDSSPVIGQYSGTLNNGIVEGEVTWTFPTMGNTQKKEHWFASLSPGALQAKLGVTPNAPRAAPRAAPLTASERGFGSDDRLLIATTVRRPVALLVEADGNLVISDLGITGIVQTDRIIRVQPASGAISSVFSGGTEVSDVIGDVTPLTGLTEDGSKGLYTYGFGRAGHGLFRISANGVVSEPVGYTLFDAARITTRPSGPPNMVHMNIGAAMGVAGDGGDNLYLSGDGIGVSKFNVKTRAVTPIVGGVMDMYKSKVTIPPDGKGVAEADWKGETIPAKTLLYHARLSGTQDEIAYDPRGNLYVQAAFNEGSCVARVVLAQDTIACLPGVHRPVQAMAVSKSGELFVAQDSKIYRYDEASDRLVKLLNAPTEYDNGPIAVDRNGTLYVLCKGYIQRISVSPH